MGLYLTAGRNGAGQPQMSIDDDDGGYRLAGGHYDGSGTILISAKIDARSAAEIRQYLDTHFPETANNKR